MKKQILKVFATILAISLCTACGANKGTDSGKVELSIGNWPATESALLTTRNQQKADFEAENENISIVPDTWAFDLKTFYPKAEARLLPDLFTAHFTEFGKMVDGEYTFDLTDVLKDYDYYDKINESIFKVITVDDRVYALPSKVYCLGIAYNTDLFEAAGLVEADGTAKQPKDWAELAEFAVKIKETTGKDGFVLTTSNNTGGWLFTNIAWSYGVDFMEQGDDGKWMATFNTPEMIEALTYVSDLKWKYDVLPENVLIDQAEQQKLFATGSAGMILSAPSASRFVKYEMDPKIYGMMAIPAGPARHVSLLGGTLNCVSNTADSKKAEAAVKWFDFIGNGCRADEKVKANIDSDLQQQVESNQAIGVKSLSIWSGETEINEYQNSAIEKYYNMKPNAAKLYNESLENSEIELQAEEPVCAQDLYGILDNCIQEVLNNKDADIAAIVEKANNDFQTNFLNNLDY